VWPSASPSTSSYKIDNPWECVTPPWQLTVVYRCKPNLRCKGIPITLQVILRSSRHIFSSEMLWQYFLVCVACFTACITLLIFLFQAKSAETTERVYHPFFRDEQRKPRIRASTYRRHFSRYNLKAAKRNQRKKLTNSVALFFNCR